MRIIIIGIVILIFSLNLNAQTKVEIQAIQKMGIGIEIRERKHNQTFNRKTQNEIQFLFKSFFIVYRKIISSQDVESCVFSPSCSVYAIESISKRGTITGLLSTFDRLTRCHPFHKNEYRVDPKTNKYYDPVEK